MPDESKDAEQMKEWHEKMAKTMFSKTWDYLDKKDRSPEEDEAMVHSCHASRAHWGYVGEQIHFQRGEWQLARVYSVLKKPVPALHYANLCLKRTLDHNIEGFDRAFAYEAIARASAIAGNHVDFEKYNQLAKEAGERIEKKEDRDYFLSTLETGEWGGMK